MMLHLIAVGTRMPMWVTEGFKEYQKRLIECKLNLIAITPSKRSKNSKVPQLIAEEEKKIQAAVPKQSRRIALDEKGELWNTKQLAQALHQWQLDRQDISFLIGGPDGLGLDCLNSAERIWSLSPLTLPHPLVRILIAEQLYRAWSMLKGHPYHRDNCIFKKF
ncbi:MAG: 23S rRNA (pseudouridine(1915)-N(3))-methyltransferase RlmH [Pseudomonadota bacterium]